LAEKVGLEASQRKKFHQCYDRLTTFIVDSGIYRRRTMELVPSNVENLLLLFFSDVSGRLRTFLRAFRHGTSSSGFEEAGTGA
jgi:hypothetical protein